MKVLLFSTLYPNHCQSTHGIFVENRLKHLVERHNVEVKVCAPVPWFPFTSKHFGQYATFAKVQNKEIRHGVEVYHPRYLVIPKVGMNLAPLLLRHSMLAFLKKMIRDGFDFDLIDAHFCYPDGIAAIWLGKQLGKPVVVTARGSDINLYRQFSSPSAQLKRWLPRANGLITVSQSLAVAVEDMGIKASKRRVLSNGINLSMFTPSQDRNSLKQKLGFTAYERHLVMVANLVELKQHKLLIAALKECDEISLSIVGDGPLSNELSAQVKMLNLQQRVKFHGRLEQEDVVSIVQASDALCLCSSREGWPNVLLEAMACGTPVVATNVGGVSEIVKPESGGVLVKEQTASSIAEGIKSLFANPKPEVSGFVAGLGGRDITINTIDTMVKTAESGQVSCHFLGIKEELLKEEFYV